MKILSKTSTSCSCNLVQQGISDSSKAIRVNEALEALIGQNELKIRSTAAGHKQAHQYYYDVSYEGVMSSFENNTQHRGSNSILKLVLVLDGRRIVELDLEVISYHGADATSQAKKQSQIEALKSLASRNGDFGYDQEYVAPDSPTSQREVHDGFLWKKGGGTSLLGRRSWQRRFCMLTTNSFRWHEDRYPHKMIKQLPLSGLQGAEQRKDPKHGIILELVHSGRNLTVKVDDGSTNLYMSNDILTRWQRALLSQMEFPCQDLLFGDRVRTEWNRRQGLKGYAEPIYDMDESENIGGGISDDDDDDIEDDTRGQYFLALHEGLLLL